MLAAPACAVPESATRAFLVSLALVACSSDEVLTGPGDDAAVRGPDAGGDAAGADAAIRTELRALESITLTRTVEGGGARPEICHFEGRFYVTYLAGVSGKGGAPDHRARIYESDAFADPTTVVLTSASPEYGMPTDVRVTRDGGALYSFYELARPDLGAHLLATKRLLDESLTLVAETARPIADGPWYYDANEGEELLDDPASTVVWGSLWVWTKIKAGDDLGHALPLYRVRQLDPSDLTVIGTTTVDLGDVANGWAFVSSLATDGDDVFHIQPTVVSAAPPVDLDLIALRLGPGWTYDPVADRIALTSAVGVETQPKGARLADGRLYVTYEVPLEEAGGKGPSSSSIWLAVFDMAGRELVRVHVSPDGAVGSHSTVEVVGDHVYVAWGARDDAEGEANVVVSVFEWM